LERAFLRSLKKAVAFRPIHHLTFLAFNGMIVFTGKKWSFIDY
jgi:hypothetical protein